MNNASSSMPTTLPAMPIREDCNVSSQQTATIKTSCGDLSLAFISGEVSESSEALLEAHVSELGQIFLNNILPAQTNKSSLIQHSLVFLKPEEISLEIEVSEFISSLDETSELETHTHEPSSSHPTSSPMKQMKYVDNTLSTPNETTSTETSSSQQKSLQQDNSSKSQSKSDNNLYSSSKLPTEAHIREQASTTKYSAEVKESKHLRSDIPFTSNDSKETIYTTKTESQFDQKEHKDHQQEENNEDSPEHQEQKQHKTKKITSVKKSSTKTFLSVNEMLYLHEISQKSNQTKQESTSSKTFMKKASSPLALFSEQQFHSSVRQVNKPPKIENVFLKFMRLMARILGQAEAEANALYLKVKERTDNVDALTLLISKINSEKGAIDWSKDEEMKALVDRARDLGVSISSENYSWAEEEKKLLKENIQMRKENLEKITQLERTDMQRHLQEVSQCHQARSNVLKLLKELMDTFVYNLRP